MGMVRLMVRPPRWASKEHARPSEIEDVVRYRACGEGLRVAVSDGATESSFAREWARLLCDEHIRSPIRDGHYLVSRVDERLADLWAGGLAQRDLPWHAREKVKWGAAATFLGLCVLPDGRWRAVAVGDTCLFQFRRGQLLTALPITQSSAFTSRPALVISLRGANARLAPHVSVREGRCDPGDVMILATDALAAWILAAVERGQNPPRTLARHRILQFEFRRWVARRRNSGDMRDDDVALCWVDARRTGRGG